MEWQQFIDSVRTGDLLFFSDYTPCLSKMIQCCMNTKFSHVAILVQSKDLEFKVDQGPGLYLIQSSALEGRQDAQDQQDKFGVKIEKLEDVLADFDGKIFWRRMVCLRDEKFKKEFNVVCRKVYNAHYNVSLSAWMNLILGLAIAPSDVGDDTKTADTTSVSIKPKNGFFCSSLVAYVYKHLGLLHEDIHWEKVSPKALSTDGSIEFSEKCTMYPERQVMRPKDI